MPWACTSSLLRALRLHLGQPMPGRRICALLAAQMPGRVAVQQGGGRLGRAQAGRAATGATDPSGGKSFGWIDVASVLFSNGVPALLIPALVTRTLKLHHPQVHCCHQASH